MTEEAAAVESEAAEVVQESDPLQEVFEPEAKEDLPEVVVEPAPEAVAAESEAEIPAEGAEAGAEKPEVKTPEELAAQVTALNQTIAEEREKKRQAQQRVYDLTQGPKPELAPKPEEAEFDWTDPKKTIDGVKTELRQEFQTNLLTMSESQCMARHEDYGEKYQVFVSMATANPAIINNMLQQPDPAEWAYSMASQKVHMDSVGADPAAYRAKIEAEVRASIEAETKQKIEAKLKTVGELPPSAASLKSKTQKAPAPIDNDPLGSVFAGTPGG